MTYSIDYRKELLKIKDETSDLKNVLSDVSNKINDNTQQIQMINSRLNAIEEVLKILVVRDTVSEIQADINK